MKVCKNDNHYTMAPYADGAIRLPNCPVVITTTPHASVEFIQKRKYLIGFPLKHLKVWRYIIGYHSFIRLISYSKFSFLG